MPRSGRGAPLQVVPPQSFGDLLRDARVARRETQAMLAERFEGVGQQLIGRWERGVAYPAEGHHSTLVHYMGLKNIDELIELIKAGRTQASVGAVGGARVSRVSHSSVDPAFESNQQTLRQIADALLRKLDREGALGDQELKILHVTAEGLSPRASRGDSDQANDPSG